ncbi:hypothetical protein [Pontivivens ytuae]|uniref:Uncharacterized protein n=1 Tax=Pontivivens ytuae TaxID=2789856 RepID=A0A7S9LRA8_9RHOB|nr:hypothetical protein [Pontivivens ytuae]QPH53818.1 hypothetical protein I0K15_18895 [Pontivivens ytuae]
MAVLAVAATLSACSGTETADGIRALSASPQALRDVYEGRTLRVFRPDTGTQIEYLASNGDAYLWSDFGPNIATGEWWTDRGRDGLVYICFRYGPEGPPAIEGGAPEDGGCSRGTSILDWTVELVEGDPFDLRNGGTVPAVLPGGADVSLAEASTLSSADITLGDDLVTWKGGAQ